MQKIAVKPLQMDTWFLLTAYRKSPPPYALVPSPTPLRLTISHNTKQMAPSNWHCIMH